MTGRDRTMYPGYRAQNKTLYIGVQNIKSNRTEYITYMCRAEEAMRLATADRTAQSVVKQIIGNGLHWKPENIRITEIMDEEQWGAFPKSRHTWGIMFGAGA